MEKTIAIVGTLDTKGEEIFFLRSLIEKRGHRTFIIDTGILGVPFLDADVSREEVAKMGGESIEALRQKNDEAFAQKIMSVGLERLVSSLVESGKIDGLIAIGGGQ